MEREYSTFVSSLGHNPACHSHKEAYAKTQICRAQDSPHLHDLASHKWFRVERLKHHAHCDSAMVPLPPKDTRKEYVSHDE